jgi:hypothetical protein
VPTVQPGEVAGRLAEGWTLLDVRTDGEWAEGRIAGSMHIPMDQLMQRLDEVEDRVVCVCAVVLAQLELPSSSMRKVVTPSTSMVASMPGRVAGSRSSADGEHAPHQGVSVRLAKRNFGSSHHMVG